MHHTAAVPCHYQRPWLHCKPSRTLQCRSCFTTHSCCSSDCVRANRDLLPGKSPHTETWQNHWVLFLSRSCPWRLYAGKEMSRTLYWEAVYLRRPPGVPCSAVVLGTLVRSGASAPPLPTCIRHACSCALNCGSKHMLRLYCVSSQITFEVALPDRERY